MTPHRKHVGLLVLAVALFGCGGSIKGPDGSTAGACATLGACECMAASDRCSARTEACWCPSECNPNIACICGGGRFLGCDDRSVVSSCEAELARVEAMCGATAMVGQVRSLCATGNPVCIQGCLAQLTTTQSCSQIVCGFCLTCDCVLPEMPSALKTCVDGCAQP